MAKEIRWSNALAAFLVVFALAGCGSKMGAVGASTGTGTDTQGVDDLLGSDSDSDLDTDSSSIIQGAYDQSSQDLSNTTAPGSVGSLSQQQTACTSASSSSSSSQSMDFFSQISQPNFYGSSSACFANQINPQQLLAQAYTFYSTMAQCQQIALNMRPQTQEDVLRMMYWATGFIMECAQRATLLESNYAYAQPLANGISIRSQAMRSSSNRIRIAIQQRGGH